jgi:NAD-dependent protein deacetylase, SIR2 family
MDSISKLKNEIIDGKVILFVGAGVSKTLGLPTWGELIDYMAEDLDYDKRIFNSYGDALTLAEYYMLRRNGLGNLGEWMITNWNIEDKIIKDSIIHSSIVSMNFPIIYTTNYDKCLEKAFELNKKDFKLVINVDDIIDKDNNDSGKTQIVKFHGDMSSKESIVLTESNYFERLDFESHLDIKLRADMLSKSILFLGYSLSDINMRLLIYKLDKIWEKSNNSSKRPQSYIFLPTPNPIQEAVLRNRKICPIVGKSTDKKESMENFLKSLI